MSAAVVYRDLPEVSITGPLLSPRVPFSLYGLVSAESSTGMIFSLLHTGAFLEVIWLLL